MHEGLVELPFHSRQGRPGTVRVTGVPAMVCPECGEALIHARLLRHVERLGEDALAAVAEFSDARKQACEMAISFCAAA